MFDRLTDNAKASLLLARTAAQEFGQDYLSPEHMLHGVLSVDPCGAARILAASNVSAADVLQKLSERMSAAEQVQPPRALLPFTPRANSVLESALRESRMLGQTRIGTEHLLVAISDSTSSVVADVLREHSLTTDLLRRALGAPKT